MAFTFYGQNNEFAASTGGNVNNGAGTSTFDYPPTSTKNLVITSQSGDDDARLFDVGDVYSLSFTGNGGTTIENATVIRSDPLSGNEGAIVFEGLNPQGDLVQVVWSPNFDLEGWYFDHFNAGHAPGFYTTDQIAETYQFACFADGTRIDTPDGPRRVEDLQPGDRVDTVDHGVRPLLWVASSTVPGLGRGAPVTIRKGVLGATTALTVSPQHRLLISDPRCALYFDAPEVLIPAVFLVDGTHLCCRNTGQVTYYHLLFERHEVVRSHGVRSESLLLGDDMSGVMNAQARAAFEQALDATFPANQCYKPARHILKRHEGPLVRKLLRLGQQDNSAKTPSFLYAA